MKKYTITLETELGSGVVTVADGEARQVHRFHPDTDEAVQMVCAVADFYGINVIVVEKEEDDA